MRADPLVTGVPEAPLAWWDTVHGAVTVVSGPPAWWVHAGAVAAAVALVGVPRLWPVARHVVTIAHEGAHAATAVMVGRRLAGVRVHSDTSGVTVSSGAATGGGVVATVLAGYIGPSLVGVAAAVACASGHAVGLLWALLVALVVLLAQVRNVYGAGAVLLAGASVFGAVWWLPGQVQVAVAFTVAWFLLLAGPRPVWELQRKRRVGLGVDADADLLAGLTGVPGGFWVGVFAVVTVGCLGGGGWLLVA